MQVFKVFGGKCFQESKVRKDTWDKLFYLLYSSSTLDSFNYGFLNSRFQILWNDP